MNHSIVSLKSLLENKELEGLDLICGQEYLNRKITGVHIMDNPDTVRFFRSGEVIMTTGYILKDFSKEEVQKLVRHLCERGCSGIIFKINRFYDTVPEDIKRAAVKYDIPIVTMPYKYAMADVQMTIMRQIFMRDYDIEAEPECELENDTDLLKILLSGTGKKEIEEKCSSYQFDTGLQYVCTVVKFENGRRNEMFCNSLRSRIKEENMVFYEYSREQVSIILIGKRNLVGASYEMKQICQWMQECINRTGEVIYAGIGDAAEDVMQIRESFSQAHQVMTLQEKRKVREVALYRDYRLMLMLYKDFKEESLRKIYQKTISGIVLYDEENHAELLKTLEVLIENRWNLKIAAEELYIHRNTLMNRREKMEALVQDTMGVDIHMAMQMGLFAYQILEFLYK